jgi:Contractile injection system tube protein
MTLEKAKLIPKDAGASPLEFMFNPTELVFEKVVETSENKAARTQDKGQPKVSFASVNAYKVTINKIIFDTYETGEDVVKKYIEPFRKAVQFVSKDDQRTPLYTFIWGGNKYLSCCFIEKLTYKLTMFSPNGTPVRALIDSLTLKEADEPKPNVALNPPSVGPATRRQDSMSNRQNGNATTPSQSNSRSDNRSSNSQNGRNGQRPSPRR